MSAPQVDDPVVGGRDDTPQGFVNAVCSRVVDLGSQSTPWGVKRQLAVLFELEERRQHGTLAGDRWILARTFNVSLKVGTALREFLEEWRGRGLTAEELRAFRMKAVVGAPACLWLEVRVSKKGYPYPVIAGIGRRRAQDRPLSVEGRGTLPAWLAELAQNGRRG